MGFDMRTVFPMTPEEQAAYKQATQAFNDAVKLRDALPAEERGTFDLKRAEANRNIDWDDHDLHTGRSERFKVAQDAVDAAYEDMNQADRSYFRLNIWGMSRYLGAMDTLGMLQGGQNQITPDWPDWHHLSDTEQEQAHDLTDQRRQEVARAEWGTGYVSEVAVIDDTPVPQAVLKVVDDQLRKTIWTPTPITGIYVGKFGSNDDWWVTPAEIRAALATYRQHTGEHVRKVLTAAGIEDTDYWGQWLLYLQYAESHGGFTVG